MGRGYSAASTLRSVAVPSPLRRTIRLLRPMQLPLHLRWWNTWIQHPFHQLQCSDTWCPHLPSPMQRLLLWLVTMRLHLPVTYVAPAPVIDYVAPAPVFGFIAPAPSQQLRPAYGDDAAVEVSASQVVGSLPLSEVFAAPVFHHVHHEQRAGGDTTEIFANFPVVQEQGVVGSLPLVEEFTAYVARRPSPLVEGVAICTRTAACCGAAPQTLLPWSRFWTVLSRRWWQQLLEVFRLLDTQLPG